MDVLFNKSAFTIRKRAYPTPEEKVLSHATANELLHSQGDEESLEVEKGMQIDQVENVSGASKRGQVF